MDETNNNQNKTPDSGKEPIKEGSTSIQKEIAEAKALGDKLLDSVQKETASLKTSPSNTPPLKVPTLLNIPTPATPKNLDQKLTLPIKKPIEQTEVKTEESTSPKVDPKNAEEKKPLKKRSSIRTYASDIAEMLQKGIATSDILLSEQKKNLAKTGTTKSPQERISDSKNRKIILITTVFIILGISALSFLIFSKKESVSGIPQTDIPSIIFANAEKEILVTDLNRNKLLAEINKERIATNGTLGSITNLYLTEEIELGRRLVKTSEFLETIEAHVKGSLVRSLEGTFMLGSHIFDGNQAFLIFNVKSFENALPGVLDWEKTIIDDLWPMFYNTKPNLTIKEDPEIGSIKAVFEDVIIRNRDARVLRTESETVLFYSFPNREHLIITTEESTLVEVIDRLTTDRFRN